VTSAGKLFQTRAAATEKERSPILDDMHIVLTQKPARVKMASRLRDGRCCIFSTLTTYAIVCTQLTNYKYTETNRPQHSCTVVANSAIGVDIEDTVIKPWSIFKPHIAQLQIVPFNNCHTLYNAILLHILFSS